MTYVLICGIIGIIGYVVKSRFAKPEFNGRVGRHLYFTYKGNSGHITLDSEFSQIDYPQVSKFIKDMVDGKIKTKPLGEHDFEKLSE